MIENTEICEGWIAAFLAYQERDRFERIARILYPYSWHEKGFGHRSIDVAVNGIVVLAEGAWIKPEAQT